MGTEELPHICINCQRQLTSLSPPFCQCCGRPFEGEISSNEFTCPNCVELDFAFDFARAALISDESSRQLVHDFKYHHLQYLSRDLGSLVGKLVQRLHGRKTHAALIPVPLHHSRKRARGFNQAHLICKFAQKHCALPIIHGLKRVRKTTPQVELNRKQRLKNLNAAFEVRKRAIEKFPSTIYLIDDVFTTGSTAHQCARILKRQSHVQKVIVVTALRG